MLFPVICHLHKRSFGKCLSLALYQNYKSTFNSAETDLFVKVIFHLITEAFPQSSFSLMGWPTNNFSQALILSPH